MSVSLEKIDMLMERANISYKEAKEALERHNGDMVEALIELESSNKTAKPKSTKNVKINVHSGKNTHRKPETDFFDEVGKFFSKMNKTSFIVGKKGHKVLDLPLTVAGLIILFTMPVSLFLLILPYVFGYKIIILDPDGKKMKFDETFSPSKEDSKEDAPSQEDRME
jgi:hypothetical protein